MERWKDHLWRRTPPCDAGKQSDEDVWMHDNVVSAGWIKLRRSYFMALCLVYTTRLMRAD